jgi:hypothetical protein
VGEKRKSVSARGKTCHVTWRGDGMYGNLRGTYGNFKGRGGNGGLVWAMPWSHLLCGIQEGGGLACNCQLTCAPLSENLMGDECPCWGGNFPFL